MLQQRDDLCFEELASLGADIQEVASVAAAGATGQQKDRFRLLHRFGRLVERSGDRAASQFGRLVLVERSGDRAAAQAPSLRRRSRSPGEVLNEALSAGLRGRSSGRGSERRAARSGAPRRRARGRARTRSATRPHKDASPCTSRASRARTATPPPSPERCSTDEEIGEGEPPLPRLGEDVPVWEHYDVENPFAVIGACKKCVFCEVIVPEGGASAHVASEKHVKFARQGWHSWQRFREEGPDLWRDGIEVKGGKFECKICGTKNQEWWRLYGMELGSDHVDHAKHKKAARKNPRREEAMPWEGRRQRQWDILLQQEATNVSSALAVIKQGKAGHDPKPDGDGRPATTPRMMRGWFGGAPRNVDEAVRMLNGLERDWAEQSRNFTAQAWLLRLAEEHPTMGPWDADDVSHVDVWLEGRGSSLVIAIDTGGDVWKVRAHECVDALDFE